MASAVEMKCPNCGKALKVPPAVFGKKIKCKHCGHAFVARDPAGPAKPAKPAAAAPPPPAPAAKKNPFLDDDDENQKIEVIEESDAPRCPHCAQELDPPDAAVCIHCGFNNITRAKATTKKVWAPTAEDWFMHLLPGVVALATVIGLIVWNVICILRMREWLTGTFLEMEEKDAAGKVKFFISPGAFIFFSLAVSLIAFVPAAKLAFRRLVREYRPPEKIKL